MRTIFILISLVLTFQFFHTLKGQTIIDEIVAVVGDEIILYSDIEKQYLQMKEEYRSKENYRCSILETLLAQKLLVNQAYIDSLKITDSQVENELERRLKYFINIFGSKEKMEEYFKKSIIEMREEFRNLIREQLLAENMRQEIIKNVTVTPSEIKKYYNSLPKDSLPYINAQVEVLQIVLYPSSSEESKREAREKLLNIRERILNGENFITLAVLYSEDPGSAFKGGDLGWVNKADLDPDYVKAVASLKEGQISRIVETSFGYHIIQLLGRTEDRIHTRHILIKPKISIEDKERTITKLDSIVNLIKNGTYTFEDAAKIFSMDEKTRFNGGIMVNPKTGSTKFELSDFSTRDYLVISKLSVGEISEPYESIDEKGNIIYKIVTIKSRTNPHIANLKEDYELIKQMALQYKEQEVLANWIKEKIKTTYIRINDNFKNCDFAIKEWVK